MFVGMFAIKVQARHILHTACQEFNLMFFSTCCLKAIRVKLHQASLGSSGAPAFPDTMFSACKCMEVGWVADVMSVDISAWNRLWMGMQSKQGKKKSNARLMLAGVLQITRC